MHKNHSFLKSLYHAVIGMKAAVKRERNLRFHLVVTNLICLFAYFYGISKVEWGLLILSIMSVITAELINTSIEKTVDTATRELRVDAKHAKDIAAAATLVTAIGALLIGILLFGNLQKIFSAINKIMINKIYLSFTICLLIIDIIFLIFPIFTKKNHHRKHIYKSGKE